MRNYLRPPLLPGELPPPPPLEGDEPPLRDGAGFEGAELLREGAELLREGAEYDGAELLREGAEYEGEELPLPVELLFDPTPLE
jgi:hypothetical protein